ncbi:hypothetical protein JBE04_22020 [Streptomyces sp. PRKS01-29]|nr:hypothetical protein [Streptomyces sabulosicollis]MBI0297072.1 hypothetical protein [Streptomyces sabulosicollis]
MGDTVTAPLRGRLMDSRGVLGSPALRLLLLTNVCAGVCLGALTVGLPARVAESGSAAGAGWMFAYGASDGT